MQLHARSVFVCVETKKKSQSHTQWILDESLRDRLLYATVTCCKYQRD